MELNWSGGDCGLTGRYWGRSAGLGIAASALVGISLGEEDIKKARRTAYTAYGVAAVCMSVIGLGFYLLAPWLAALFTNTPDVQSQAVAVIRLIAFFQPMAAMTQIMTSALQGAGDTKFPMYATLIGIWVIRVGVGYILAVICGLGLMGVWMGYAADLTVRGSLLFVRFLGRRWQNVKI